MFIYRVENSKGDGPFNGCFDNPHLSDQAAFSVFERLWFKSRENAPQTHPDARSDGIKVSRNDKFACETLQDLVYWFDVNVHQILIQSNFFIAMYEVPYSGIKIGKSRQVAYNKRYAKRVKKLHISELKLC